MFTVTGPFMRDNNFITLFNVENKSVFTMALNDPESWGWSRVGCQLDCGFILTQALFDKWREGCEETGTFMFTDVAWYRTA